jgi:hypothetical protein
MKDPGWRTFIGLALLFAAVIAHQFLGHPDDGCGSPDPEGPATVKP